MDIWKLYETYATPESRSPLSDGQRQLLAVCDFRQEVNSGGFGGYLRFWGADTAADALVILPRALGEPWRQVLTEALELCGATNLSTADERAAVLDGAEGASEVLGLLDDRFYELEGAQDADAALGRLADEFSPWPGAETSKAKRGFRPRKSNQ